MTFLDLLTLRDVFIAGTGLVIASLIRIYYDAYMEKRKLKRFTQSLTVYNCLIEENKDGIMIITDDNEIIYANEEMLHQLHTERKHLSASYLEKITLTYENTRQTLLQTIHNRTHIPQANLALSNTQNPAISLSINKMPTDGRIHWNIVVLRDMESMCELRDRTIDLLGAA